MDVVCICVSVGQTEKERGQQIVYEGQLQEVLLSDAQDQNEKCLEVLKDISQWYYTVHVGSVISQEKSNKTSLLLVRLTGITPVL